MRAPTRRNHLRLAQPRHGLDGRSARQHHPLMMNGAPQAGDPAGKTSGATLERPEHARSRHALIVDDDADSAELLADVVRADGFVTATAGTLAEARQHIVMFEPDLILLDLMLPDGSGLDLFADVERPRQHRGRAGHRPRKPRDVDPGVAPWRCGLPGQTGERAAAEGRPVAGHAAGRAGEAESRRTRTTSASSAASAASGAARG